MIVKSKSLTWALFLAAAYVAPGQADTFWSISGDPNNFYVPDVLSSVDSGAQTVTTIAAMGGGNLGFNGGLTVGPGGKLYAIANDSFGNGSFYSIQADGTLSLIGSAGGLGQGFLGGLTYDTQNSTFYAAVLDSAGNTSLDSISQTGQATDLSQSLGAGFSGLAFDSANDLFYGIANDNTGFSTLVDFSLSGPVNNVGALGYGFGALTYDQNNDVFWALAPVNNAASTLFQITALAEESNGIFTLGDGFAELAVQPQAQTAAVPEPATVAELGTAICLLALILKRKASRPGPGTVTGLLQLNSNLPISRRTK
jgi:hypothetical protein